MFNLVLVVAWYIVLARGAVISSVDENHKSVPRRICSKSDDRNILHQIELFIKLGQLSIGRQIANECLLLTQHPEKTSKLEHLIFDSIIGCCSTPREIIDTYYSASEELFNGDDNFLSKIEEAIIQSIHSNDEKEVHTDASCFAEDEISMDLLEPFSRDGFPPENIGKTRGTLAIEHWNERCSYFEKKQYNYDVPGEFRAFLHPLAPATLSSSCSQYCAIAPGSYNHLVLPALREPRVNISLEFRKFAFENGNWIMEGERSNGMLDIEQEGSLRMYDVSGVLWPAGYLLGLCLANPIKCGVPEVLDAIRSKSDNSGAPIAIELGSGVGFPSVALAKTMKHQGYFHSHAIVATDSSKASCALIIQNSYQNGVGNMINVTELNHMEYSSLSNLREHFFGNFIDEKIGEGFNLIFGSSLQGLFYETSKTNAKLWRTLDALLSKTDPNAVVILSHVRSGNERIEVPEYKHNRGGFATFECIRRISGDTFDMRTRDDNPSDFEIVLLRRSH
mmetsp:Transcript_6082/g.12426  ORF Transcript_6082/g.12426 Transcript_6082/m.12426 type:complete len:506 (-) Transcript_6082:32-1549(-)